MKTPLLSLRSWLVLGVACWGILSATTLQAQVKQEKLDQLEPEDNPNTPLVSQMKVRVRYVKTVPEVKSVDLWWRVGGEGLGGDVKAGRFDPGDTPQPDIDKPLDDTPMGDRHVKIGEWSTWFPMVSIGGGFPTVWAAATPATTSKEPTFRFTQAVVEFEFSRRGKSVKKFIEASPQGGSVTFVYPSGLLRDEKTFPAFVAGLQGLSTYVKARRERVEKLFPDDYPRPDKFTVLGRLGGYGQDGMARRVRHTNLQILLDEIRTERLLGINAIKEGRGFLEFAPPAEREYFNRLAWSGSGVPVVPEFVEGVGTCPFDPRLPELRKAGFEKVLASHQQSLGSQKYWVQAGDEIGVAVRDHMVGCPKCREAFCEFLGKNRVTPEQVGAKSWEEVELYPMFAVVDPSDPMAKPVTPPLPTEVPDKLRYYYTYRMMTYLTGEAYSHGARMYHEHGVPLFSMMQPTPSWSGSALDWHEFFDMQGNTALVWETSNRDARIWQWESYVGDIARGISHRHGDLPIGCLVKPHRGAPIQRMLSIVTRGVKAFEWYTYGPDYSKGDSWSQSPYVVELVGRAGKFLGQAEPWLYGARWAGQPEVAFVVPRSTQIWTGQSPLYTTTFEDAKWIYLALVHEHIPVDILSEQQLAEEGSLKPYKVLYIPGTNLRRDAAAKVTEWVREGGSLWTNASGLARDEANNPAPISTEVLGMSERKLESWGQAPGYGATGIGSLVESDPPAGAEFEWNIDDPAKQQKMKARVGREPLTPIDGQVIARFSDGQPAVSRRKFGKGTVEVAGFWPGLTYSSKVRRGDYNMQVDYDAGLRELIAAVALEKNVYRPVVPANAQVEAVWLDNGGKHSIALMNWGYGVPQTGSVKALGFLPLEQVDIALPSGGPIKSARSLAHGDLPLKQVGGVPHVTLPKLGEVDLIVVE